MIAVLAIFEVKVVVNEDTHQKHLFWIACNQEEQRFGTLLAIQFSAVVGKRQFCAGSGEVLGCVVESYSFVGRSRGCCLTG